MLGDFFGLLGICAGVYLVYIGLSEMADRKEKQQKHHCNGCCGHHHDADGDPEYKCGGNCNCKKDNE